MSQNRDRFDERRSGQQGTPTQGTGQGPARQGQPQPQQGTTSQVGAGGFGQPWGQTTQQGQQPQQGLQPQQGAQFGQQGQYTGTSQGFQPTGIQQGPTTTAQMGQQARSPGQAPSTSQYGGSFQQGTVTGQPGAPGTQGQAGASQSMTTTGVSQQQPLGAPGQAGAGYATTPGAAAGQQRGVGRPLLQPITVHDIIHTEVVTANRDTPIATIVAQMAEREVGAVVVVEDNRPVGIVTDRKIALALEETPDVSDLTADDLLSEDLYTGTTDMNISEMLQILGREEIRRLPIVDEEGSLAGIVTLDDVLVLLASEFKNITDIIEAQSPWY